MLLLFADSLIYKDFLKPIIEVATLIFLAYTYLSQRKVIKIQDETISIQKKEINDKVLKEAKNSLQTKLAIKGVIDELLLPKMEEVKLDYENLKLKIQGNTNEPFKFTIITPLSNRISNIFDKTEIVDAFKNSESISLPMLLNAENLLDFVIENPPNELSRSFNDKKNSPTKEYTIHNLQYNYSRNIANRIADIEYAIAIFKKISEELKK